MDHLNHHIDLMLDQCRPDRYDVGDNTWRLQVYADVEARLPVRRAIAIAAQQIVDQREGIATRVANGLLRKIGETKQWPFDWMDAAERPLSIGRERVKLTAATAEDLQQWAIDERRDAAQDFAARSAACDGAEWAAKNMATAGLLTIGDVISAQCVSAA